MSKLLNLAVKTYLKYVHHSLHKAASTPIVTQEKVFSKLLANFKNTKYGKLHSIRQVNNIATFQKALPVTGYEELKPYIERMMKGENDVLVGGSVRFFSKSSGTTNDKSKYIPVPRVNLFKNHIKSSWDSLALFYDKRPDAELFNKKSLVVCGSISHYEQNPKTIIGDISAIMTKNMPSVARSFYTPDFETAMLPDWEEKIKRITKITLDQDVVMVGGVPTWLLVIFRELIKHTGKENMLEIWPNLQGYFHGGVGFNPYLEQFKKLIPSDKFVYQEVYNASEGFFGVQDGLSEDGMMLLINNGVFFEFLPVSEWEKSDPYSLTLDEVDLNTPYAIVITSNNGLMRYKVGDVVEFTSKTPFKFKIKGRTQHFINTFGEEVMVDNTDKAIGLTCQTFDATISDYTAGPIYMSESDKGGHEWVVEFDKEPHDIAKFAIVLDENLRKLNSDYDAKRAYDLALLPLKLINVPKGTFHKWLQSRNKLGGQHKVPRLANHREFIEALLDHSQLRTTVKR